MNKKLPIVIILVAVAALLAILSNNTVAVKGRKIAVLINNTSNPYWQTFHEGLSETAKKMDIEVHIKVLGNTTDAEAQLNQCEVTLLQKPNALLFAAVNGVNLAPCLQKANAQGIALIDVDGNLSQKLAQKIGVKVEFSVASNNYILGQKAAEYLQSQSGKVLVLEGLSGSEPSRLRVDGFKENLPKNLEIMASQAGDWDRMKALDITNRMIIQHPDLSAIFAANDTMALGAVEALRAAKKENVIVIGIDGTIDAVLSIQEGHLTASIAQLPYLMAKEALEKTTLFLSEEKQYEFQQYVPVVTLDKEIINNKNEALLKYVR